MDLRVLVAYRYIFASAFLAPLAYFVERKNRTKVTWRVLGLSFVCGLSGWVVNQCIHACIAHSRNNYMHTCRGTVAQNLYIAGMKATTATFATATTNLLPAVTFLLALAFRYERLSIRTLPGQAKVAGTLLGIGGAMLLTFYKGVDVTPWHSHVNLLAHHAVSDAAASSNYAMGSLLCVGSCFFYAFWLVIQTKLSNEYPFHYSSTALMCAMASLQSTAFALCFDRDYAGQWRLRLGVRLLSVVYAGVMASGVMLVVMSWCVKKRGPLFVSVFNPLMLLVVAVLGSLLLGEKLHLGTALGAVFIVMGLYSVLWGKARETPATAKLHDLPTTGRVNDDGSIVDDVAPPSAPPVALTKLTVVV
ncbi:hypothetical protein HU200_064227 [Digitaria exilis]|uniref:WAT1-related protein n=1 Tax=Digitaria exilis TaxID=1010633 RepID=A0A835A0A4_9POAL|nr:hypothetical protein HU200_064227 [Digitaria exilis]